MMLDKLIKLQDMLWEINQLRGELTIADLQDYKKQWRFKIVDGQHRIESYRGVVRWQEGVGWRYGECEAIHLVLDEMLERYGRVFEMLERIGYLKAREQKMEEERLTYALEQAKKQQGVRDMAKVLSDQHK
jgi:hypothetical protein